ncbi:hypothetical protein CCAN2_1850048 [Capnocytophaga canimorsus]|nr:hypothetical protein CCAN2_1850048 [Capnocytophaga canimorsus]
MAERHRQAGQMPKRPQVTETIVREQPKIGRNERVTIQNILSGEIKELKFKQALPLLERGEWVVKTK